MEELRHETTQGEEKVKNYPVPKGMEIKVAVRRDLKRKAVILEVGVDSVALTIQGARDLALALRQNANIVERNG